LAEIFTNKRIKSDVGDFHDYWVHRGDTTPAGAAGVTILDNIGKFFKEADDPDAKFPPVKKTQLF
jgi:hypothetical protein